MVQEELWRHGAVTNRARQAVWKILWLASHRLHKDKHRQPEVSNGTSSLEADLEVTLNSINVQEMRSAAILRSRSDGRSWKSKYPSSRGL